MIYRTDPWKSMEMRLRSTLRQRTAPLETFWRTLGGQASGKAEGRFWLYECGRDIARYVVHRRCRGLSLTSVLTYQLERIQSEIIDPFLRLHHLPTYHSNPEFHTSFAWVLVPVPEPTDSPSLVGTVDDPFTEKVMENLQKEFGKAILDAQPKGGWQVDGISTKIGKTCRDFALSPNVI